MEKILLNRFSRPVSSRGSDWGKNFGSSNFMGDKSAMPSDGTSDVSETFACIPQSAGFLGYFICFFIAETERNVGLFGGL